MPNNGSHQHATLVELKAKDSIATIARRARVAVAKCISRDVRSTLDAVHSGSFSINRPMTGGFIDSVHVDPSGIVRIVGWCGSEFQADFAPSVCLDGRPVPFLQCFRFQRTDVEPTPDTMPLPAGLALDYLVPESVFAGGATVLTINLDATSRLRFEADFHFVVPHYWSLLSARNVFHRNDIYGSGPPNMAVHPEVLELAKRLKGPVLDFGCGRGSLVRELQSLGVEAHGLELDSAIIRESISPQIANSITFYDGSFPSPFPDGRFQSVICSEVLEHISDYQAAIQDIARLATKQVIFTVPDASAIPLGFRHGVVPWHLLEGTHVNFFTQQSLQCALHPYFHKIRFGRIGSVQVNDTEFHVSLTASCLKA